MAGIFDWLVAAVFPLHCSGCGVEGAALCDACVLLARVEEGGLEGFIEGEGKDNAGKMSGIDVLFTMYPYADRAVKGALRQAKFDAVEDSRNALEDLCLRGMRALRIAERITGNGEGMRDRIVIVPIPTPGARERERGFDQVRWLADCIAGELRDAAVFDCLRARPRARQSRLKLASERERNIQGAFALKDLGWNGNGARERLAGARVIVVDDVVTSGSTIVEAARVLRTAGAREVMVIALARGGRVEPAQKS